MTQKALLFAALLLSSVTGAMAQSSSSANPLNQFIGAANSAAAAINSANAKQTTPSSSSPTLNSPTQAAATSASPSPAAHHSGINRTTLIVAVVCAVIGALLLAALLGLCCWCLVRRRRRRRNAAHATIDDEVKTWRSNEPKNPGRDYSPHRNSRITSMEQQPMIPPAAKAPDMQQHPALRNHNADNPFVPVPPGPRRQAPNSRAGLTDGTVPGAAPYVLPEPQVLHKGRSRSSSRPRTTSNPALPKANTSSRPSTPFGLSGVGQPYEDMHVHVLQTESPSRELRQSLHNREPIVSPPVDPIHRYDTPPTVPSRSPNRHSTASIPSNNNASNSVTGETSSTEGSTSADDWRYNKASSFANIPPWEQRQHRYSNSPHSSTGNAYNISAPPPIPWETSQTRYESPSHSPRQSRDFRQSGNGTAGYVEGARRNSRSPATRINWQPRRLRFSDLQADEMGYKGYRHSQGVGEAL
ncbi:MAG: hypothetical protein L6R41_000165 [Letrouitia leprolyta]|nr:MAG: hypothetical protein L6R41_000165 [Letrouitia leprolyta]